MLGVTAKEGLSGETTFHLRPKGRWQSCEDLGGALSRKAANTRISSTVYCNLGAKLAKERGARLI